MLCYVMYTLTGLFHPFQLREYISVFVKWIWRPNHSERILENVCAPTHYMLPLLVANWRDGMKVLFIYVCVIIWGEEKCAQNFCWKTWGEEAIWKTWA